MTFENNEFWVAGSLGNIKQHLFGYGKSFQQRIVSFFLEKGEMEQWSLPKIELGIWAWLDIDDVQEKRCWWKKSG